MLKMLGPRVFQDALNYSLIYHSIGVATDAYNVLGALCKTAATQRLPLHWIAIFASSKKHSSSQLQPPSVTPRIFCSFKASAFPWNWVEQARQCRQDSVRLEVSTHSEIQFELGWGAILGWVGYRCFITVSHLNNPKWKVCLHLAEGSIIPQEHKPNL